MGTLQVRQHDRKSRLWWVSADSGEDVAYIARPGTNYWAWITDKWGSEYPSFVGTPFKSVDEALEAIRNESESPF
jgi:hypothetical protein